MVVRMQKQSHLLVIAFLLPSCCLFVAFLLPSCCLLVVEEPPVMFMHIDCSECISKILFFFTRMEEEEFKGMNCFDILVHAASTRLLFHMILNHSSNQHFAVLKETFFNDYITSTKKSTFLFSSALFNCIVFLSSPKRRNSTN